MNTPVSNKPTLLCVDDNPSVLKMYEVIFAGFGYAVTVANSGMAAVRQVHGQRPDLIILDHEVFGTANGELASRFRKVTANVPLILVSACSSVVEDGSHFLDATLNKSSPIQVLIDQVETLLHASSAQRRSAGLVEHLA